MPQNVAALPLKRLVTPGALLILWLHASSIAWAADAAKRNFDLAAGDAAETLKQFAAQASREIMFPAEPVAGVRTHALKGAFTPRDALERMVAHTGLFVVEDGKTGALLINRTVHPAQPNPPFPSQSDPNGKAPELSPKTMNPKPKNLVILVTGWLAVALAPVHGAEAVSAKPPTAGVDQTTVVLSPFEVNASQDQGYIATNSLSGSRVNTPLYTTPSVTSVFTRDFLDDIAANDLIEAYTFGLNVDALEQPEQSSNFRPNLGSDSAVNIRGLAAATARNYFVWDVNSDSYNIERIDFSRGPNNVLNGVGGFGGVINSTTKRATIGRDVTRFQFRVGDWNLYRGQLDIGRTIGKNVALRVNLLQQAEGGWKHHAKYDRVAMDVAGTWRIFNSPSASTVLRADYEKLNSNRVIGNRFPFRDFATSWNGVGIPEGTANNSTSLGSLGVTGVAAPQLANRRMLLQGTNTFITNTGTFRSIGRSGSSFTDERVAPRAVNFEGNPPNDSDVENLTVMLEQKLFRDFFVEFAFNRQREFFIRNRADFGWDLFRDPNLTLNGAPNPRFGDYFADFQYDRDGTETKVDELRGTASYERDLGKFGRHQFAALASRRAALANRNAFTFDDIGSNNQLLIRRYLRDGDGLNNTGFDPNRIAADAARANLNVGFRQSNLTHGESLQNTIQAVHVGNFFSGRLSTVLGVRNDKLFGRSVLNGTTDVITSEPLFKRRRQWNNYQLTPWIFAAGDITRTKGFTLGWSAESPVRVYYNESGSFVNQNQRKFVSLFERPTVPFPRLGDGKDMGVRFQLFDKRVQGSIGRFETIDRNSLPGLAGQFLQAVQFVARTAYPQQNALTPLQNWDDAIAVVSKGYEAEITANVTRNLRLHFNYSHTELTNSDHGPDTKKIIIGQMLPQWRTWVSGWRQGPGEVLPAGVSNNTAPAVNAGELGRPLTFLEAHGRAINPYYELGDRGAIPSAAGTTDGLQDWISLVNWTSDIWFLDGLPPRRHRPDSFNVVANYTFDRDSRLKGWTTGVSARWRGPAVLDRYFDSKSNVIEVMGKPRMDTDLNIAYVHKFKRFTLKNQLNVKNVFNSGTTEVINVAGNADERGHLQYQDPRNIRLTMDFIY